MQRYGLVLVALTVCASAARAQKVKVDWDRATDFTPYKTYKWTKIPTPRTPTPEMEKLIHDVADMQLKARGLKRIENGEPDVYVGYSITLGNPKKEGAAPSTTESSSWQAGSSWSAQLSSDQAARKGTLNIDIADTKKNLLIWRGTVMAEVGDSVNDARVKVSRGISKAFEKFPPPAK
jgi:hypothetical protein